MGKCVGGDSVLGIISMPNKTQNQVKVGVGVLILKGFHSLHFPRVI